MNYYTYGPQNILSTPTFVSPTVFYIDASPSVSLIEQFTNTPIKDVKMVLTAYGGKSVITGAD